ncbi:HupE/UreJ family protein [Pseudomonas aeruginosa]
MKNIALYVTVFAIGHSTTMLLGVYFNVGLNSFFIYAVIVLYGGLEGTRQNRLI